MTLLEMKDGIIEKQKKELQEKQTKILGLEIKLGFSEKILKIELQKFQKVKQELEAYKISKS